MYLVIVESMASTEIIHVPEQFANLTRGFVYYLEHGPDPSSLTVSRRSGSFLAKLEVTGNADRVLASVEAMVKGAETLTGSPASS